MRVIALDVGQRRIGFAVGETGAKLASPVTAIRRGRSLAKDMVAVLRLVDEERADMILVGMPLSLSGKAGPQAKLVSRFVEELEGTTPTEVRTFDERYSTAEAERRLIAAGIRPSEDRGRTDAAAAAVILEAFFATL